jgi:hypothetical protein
MILACGRIRQKRDGLGVRHASQGKEGVHLMLANPPWRRLRERAEKIPRDQKHDYELGGVSHRVIALRSSIQHRNPWRAMNSAKNAWTASLCPATQVVSNLTQPVGGCAVSPFPHSSRLTAPCKHHRRRSQVGKARNPETPTASADRGGRPWRLRERAVRPLAYHLADCRGRAGSWNSEFEGRSRSWHRAVL